MSPRLHAQRLASDLNLIASKGSLLVQPGISGPGQEQVLATGFSSVFRLA